MHTHTHTHTDTQTHRHTDTDTDTHRHTDTQTHTHQCLCPVTSVDILQLFFLKWKANQCGHYHMMASLSKSKVYKRSPGKILSAAPHRRNEAPALCVEPCGAAYAAQPHSRSQCLREVYHADVRSVCGPGCTGRAGSGGRSGPHQRPPHRRQRWASDRRCPRRR